MSRIRSVHPGLWTDERYVAVSAYARLLWIGIWNECDDAGSFEWSPLKLKMRILPADNVDVPSLLAELEAQQCIMSYEVDGRKLGAVRNFKLYQRPKKPNSVYPQPPSVRKFVEPKSGEVTHQLPTSGEISPQMEDGGGREGSEDAVASPAAEPDPPKPAEPPFDPDKVMFDAGVALMTDAGIAPAKSRPMLGKWRRDHGTEQVITAISRAKREGAIDPISFIEGCLRNGGPNGSGNRSGRYDGGGFRDVVLGDIALGRDS